MTTPAPEWTYSGDPSTSLRDEVRFLVQDTDESLQLISNAELDYLIATWMPRYDSVFMVAARAASIISRKFAGVVNISADGVSVNVSDISGKYATLATQLKSEHSDAMSVGGTVDLANLMVGRQPDPSIDPLNFGVGMHDNYDAGNQGISRRALGPDWVSDR